MNENAHTNRDVIAASASGRLRAGLQKFGAVAVRALRHPRLRKLALALGVSLILVALIGFFALPALLRPVLEQQLSQTLGRTVSLGSMRINPFSLSASLRDFRIAEAKGNEPFLQLGELYADFSASSLFRLAPVLRELRVDKLQLHLVREAPQQYNFSDLIARLTAAPAEPTSSATAFALYNIRVQDAGILFDDRVTGQQHRIESLNIGLPFISNLPGKIETFVTPALNARVNGSPFALEGELKPFADHREAHLRLKLEPTDLTRYLAYLPMKLPLALKQAELGMDMRLLWSEGTAEQQTLSLQGALDLGKLKLAAPEGESVLTLDRLHLALKQFQPLAQPMRVDLAKIALDGPALNLRRDAKGRLSIAQLLAAPAPANKKSSAPAADPLFSLDELVLQGGAVHWEDEVVPGGYKGGVKDLALKLTNFDLAGTRKANLALDMTGEREAKIGLQGTVQGTQRVDLRAQLAALPLGQYLPYLRDVVRKGELEGDMEGEAHLVLQRNGDAFDIGLDEVRSKLSQLRLTEPGQRKPILQVAMIELAGLSVDMQSQRVQVSELRSTGGKLQLVRDAAGVLDLLRVIRGEEVADAAKEVASEIRSKEWGFSIEKLGVGDWSLSLEDRRVEPAVRIALDRFSLDLAAISNLGQRLGALRLSAAINKKGSIKLDGNIGLAPLRGDLKLSAQAADVLIAQPYVDDLFRVLITRGQLFADGRARFDLTDLAKPSLSYVGDIALRDFNSLDTLNDTDFLRWKNFALEGLDMTLDPLRINVRSVGLESFYTRLILDQQGRFNLRELRLQDEDAAAPPPPTTAPTTAATTAPAYAMRIDKLSFDKGDVNFSDRFIKPNYDAHLLRVNGSLTGLSTDATTLAALALTAALDGNAPVRVEGQFNPFRQDRVLDVKAEVSDVDLTGVSTYAAKYVGYGISRGKLSMKLDYKIRDRKLSAENQVFLDQLTFGDKVESADATKLPVQLAVALLKDSQGRIDVNLPISGSLDDPEFSMGGVIWRVIGNLLTKAITSPFALIGSLFGGNSEELAFVEFPSGSAEITPAAEEKLKSLAKALMDRPALRLDISGRADPATDTASLKRALLENRLRALKAEALVKKGESVAEVDALEIETTEREQLISEAYKREKFEKPRNALGIVRELPAAEAEKMILENTEISASDLQALASQRATRVRNWISSQGGVPGERVFLLAPVEDKSKQAARAEFALR